MKWIFLLLPVAIVSGCQETGISLKSNIGPKQEVGLVKTQVTPEASFIVEYLPGYQKRAEESNRVSDNDNASVFYYFRFSIRAEMLKKNKDLIQLLNYQLQPDFTLAMDTDSIPCIFYQTIPKGNSTTTEFLVAFEKEKTGKVPSGNMQLVFNDRHITNRALVFSYTPKDLANTTIQKLNEKGTKV